MKNVDPNGRYRRKAGAGEDRKQCPMRVKPGIEFPSPCNSPANPRYDPREVGGGRAARQPGQVRKEAAPTSQARVAVPASRLFFSKAKWNEKMTVNWRGAVLASLSILTACQTVNKSTVKDLPNGMICEMLGPAWITTFEERKALYAEQDARKIYCGPTIGVAIKRL